MLTNLPDPRPPFAGHDAMPAPIADAHASLAASARGVADAANARIDAALAAALASVHEDRLAAIFAVAATVDVRRLLWRRLVALAQQPRAAAAGDLAFTLFALPLVIVVAADAGVDAAHDDAAAARSAVPVPGTVPDAGALAALLREHHALAGNATFVIADALAAADALELAALPALYGHAAAAIGGAVPPLAMTPRPIVPAAHEAVHLRFLVGIALSAPTARLLDDRQVGG